MGSRRIDDLSSAVPASRRFQWTLDPKLRGRKLPEPKGLPMEISSLRSCPETWSGLRSSFGDTSPGCSQRRADIPEGRARWRIWFRRFS